MNRCFLRSGDLSHCPILTDKGTNRYFRRVAAEFGLEVTFADCTKPELLKAALKANTKVSQHTLFVCVCLVCRYCLFQHISAEVVVTEYFSHIRFRTAEKYTN